MANSIDTPRESTPPAIRRPRNRPATESEILAAALRLLERDGVLSGLNLREVADEAGVNRGLIYQYYGSRQELLRAAILKLGWGEHPIFHAGQSLPFVERRLEVFTESLRKQEAIRLIALLALDKRSDTVFFPMLEQTKETLRRDQSSGALASDVDGLSAHIMTAATYLGYSIFRDAFAKEAGLSPDYLDEKVTEAYARMLHGLSVPGNHVTSAKP